MTIWIIEPRDPLIVRDGRPFGPDPGARAATLPFPFPSTVAGGLRGLAGRTQAQTFDATLKDDVRNLVHVRGPLLIELGDQNQVTWFAPAPADASIHQTEKYDKDSGTLVRFVPAELTGAYADATDSLLVQAGEPDIHKAHPLAPQFWSWKDMSTWLLAQPSDGADVICNGVRALKTSTRMHVKIKPETQTADEGFLYQTRGLEFATKTRKRLALAAQVEVVDKADRMFAHFAGGMAPLGGERRLMHWEQSTTILPGASADLFEQIGKQKACRLVLLTPAYFTAGYRPDLTNLAGQLHPELAAAAVPRAQVVSGWDMLHRNSNDTLGAPKPTRRLAPAGAVYFVRFGDNDTSQAIEQWARDLWMSCISEDPQSKRDGFGLVALGVWDNQIKQIGA